MKVSDIKKGMAVWIPCEVRGGPFPDERRVFVKTESSEWFGFVSVSQLTKVKETDLVRAIVLAVHPGHVVLGIRGQSPANGPVEASPSLVAQYGAVPA